MSITSNIRKLIVVSFWCIVSAGILVLLIAAMREKKEKICVGYEIDITGSDDHNFIDKKDIENQLSNGGVLSVKGRSIKSFDLKKLEEKLERNSWVSDAELFFDNNQLLKVTVAERQPIARVFTVSGTSYYIDSSLTRLPLSDKLSARLPVFTGFPGEKENVPSADSVLTTHMRAMANYIRTNRFWMAQVAQIDITAARTFEIIPTIGSTIIEFGDGNELEKKFRRLMLFYQQVISKTGFAGYERIKVQFSGQVVGVRHAAAISTFDSLQAIKNVQQLIALAQTEQERLIKLDSIDIQSMEHRSDRDESPSVIYDTNVIKKNNIDTSGNLSEKNATKESPTMKSPPPYEPGKKSNPEKKQAKAVMRES